MPEDRALCDELQYDVCSSYLTLYDVAVDGDVRRIPTVPRSVFIVRCRPSMQLGSILETECFNVFPNWEAVR